MGIIEATVAGLSVFAIAFLTWAAWTDPKAYKVLGKGVVLVMTVAATGALGYGLGFKYGSLGATAQIVSENPSGLQLPPIDHFEAGVPFVLAICVALAYSALLVVIAEWRDYRSRFEATHCGTRIS